MRLGADDAGFRGLIGRPGALPDDPGEAGLFHTAFLLPSRADLGRWLAQAGARGQPLDGAADHLVGEMVYLSDPEGDGVEVYADRSRARWRWTGEAGKRRLEMTSRPLDAEGLLGEARTPRLGAPDGTRIGHVHLRVGNPAEAARFYGGALARRRLPVHGRLSPHVAANSWRSAGCATRGARCCTPRPLPALALRTRPMRDREGEEPMSFTSTGPGPGLGTSRAGALAAEWAPRLLSVLRIVAALIFIEHGTQKLFGFPPRMGGAPQGPALFSLLWCAAVIELVGGLLLLAGLFTRPVAFLLSGEMAFAYWIAHAPRSPFPALNGGDAAILYCFVFLYLAAAGGGAWSLDAARSRRGAVP